MNPGKNNIYTKMNMTQPLMEGSKPKTYIPKVNHTKTGSNFVRPSGLINLKSLITSASSKCQDLIKPEIQIMSKFKDKTINKIKNKTEEHENTKFILHAVTGGIVGLVLYLAK
jgi:hypothetical protein